MAAETLSEPMDEEPLEDGSGILGLPAKFSTWRPSQEAVATEIAMDILRGKRFVVCEMPTGSGKTMISMAARQILDMKTLYVCTTKTLQDQFLADFPHAKLIKGRSNYACGLMPDKFPTATAEDCPGEKCKANCPYKSAKDDAVRSQLTVMNMSYYLAEIQHVGAFAGRELVVIDEADTLEDALLEQVSVTITIADIKALGLGQPEYKTKFESWKTWAVQAREIVRQKSVELKKGLEAKRRNVDEWETIPLGLLREQRRYERMGAKLGWFLKYVDQYWVWEHTAGEGFNLRGKPYSDKWVFKPVRVDQFGDIIFNAAENFILMSATILNFKQYMRNVGLMKYAEEEKTATLELGSVFDASKRPVIVMKGIDLTYANKEAGMKELPRKIKEVLDRHPNEKGVIHAVTYDIANAIVRAFPDRCITHFAATRREAIDLFKASTKPLVLVSPSIERGEDFPDDLCRFIAIVKIPYPYLGDDRVNKRLHHKDGQTWYTLKTVSKIVQMTGRGMRHEDDQCTSYILASGFRKLFMQNRSMFPRWWRDALIWESLNTGGREGKRIASEEKAEAQETVLEEDWSTAH